MFVVDEDGVVREEFASVPFFRTPFNYNRDAVSAAVVVHGATPDDPSMTKQSFKEESDINTIVRNFGLTGELPQDVSMPISGDFTEAVTDFHTAQNMLRQSLEAFMLFPADVRARFHNDPQEMMDFVEDKANLEEARKLGLAVPAVPPPVPPAPMAVRIVPDDVEPKAK